MMLVVVFSERVCTDRLVSRYIFPSGLTTGCVNTWFAL